jgi:beta-lactam-binding protein with PASTA domain
VTEIDQFWIYNGSGQYGPGNNDETAIVPDLTGMTTDDAVVALKEAGLELGNISYVISSDDEKGVVERQDPPAGSSLVPGSSVDITINGE